MALSEQIRERGIQISEKISEFLLSLDPNAMKEPNNSQRTYCGHVQREHAVRLRWYAETTKQYGPTTYVVLGYAAVTYAEFRYFARTNMYSVMFFPELGLSREKPLSLENTPYNWGDIQRLFTELYRIPLPDPRASIPPDIYPSE